MEKDSTWSYRKVVWTISRNSRLYWQSIQQTFLQWKYFGWRIFLLLIKVVGVFLCYVITLLCALLWNTLFYFVYRQKNLSQKKKLRKIVVKIDVLENSDPNQIVESVVKPEDAVSWVKEYEKLIRSKKQIVINTAYCQEHILQKFKKSKTFVEMVKDLIIR